MTTLSGLSAIVLAAGLGTRLGGECKPLKRWQNKPLIHHCLDTLCQLQLDQVIVVAGDHSDEISEAVSGYSVKLAINTTPEKGMSSSIRCGIDAFSMDSKGAFICLSDMPMIPNRVYEYLFAGFSRQLEKSIFIPTFNDQKGHPVLFRSDWFADLKELSGDRGAKQLIKNNSDKVELVPIDDQGILIDFDHTEDFSKSYQS